MSSKKPRKVNILHLIYIVIICLLIILFLILQTPGKVSDSAFDNFSFASTITSIVLAVVSIVYSIQSGLISLGRMNSIKDIEDDVKKTLHKFDGLEKKISKQLNETVLPINKKLDEVSSRQQEMKEDQTAILSLAKNSHANNNSKSEPDTSGRPQFCNNQNSMIGCIVLYMCALSQKYKKPLSSGLKITKDYSNYIYGYIIALSLCEYGNIEFSSDNNDVLNSTITYFNTDFFSNIESIKNEIDQRLQNEQDEENKKAINEMLKEIENYFQGQGTDSV